jgi:hypothetical protein
MNELTSFKTAEQEIMLQNPRIYHKRLQKNTVCLFPEFK